LSGFKHIFLLMSLVMMSLSLWANDSIQFRGPNRDGVFSKEKGLLKSWPEAGPTVMWQAEGLGNGFSSAVTSGDKIFTTGESNFKDVVFALDAKGKALWQTEYSDAHPGGGYPGTRTTPTVDGDHLYVMSSFGEVVCLNKDTGKIVWSLKTLEHFAKKKAESYIPRWAVAESVLVVGNKVICTPGVPGATVVALDKNTGKVIWTTKGLEDISGYCSARVFDNGKVRQIVTMTGVSMVGVDLNSGKLLWSHSYPASWEIHANSPLFEGNTIYVSDGYGKGGSAFQLAEDGKSIKKLWAEETLDIHHGGGVCVDGFIYGASNRGKWMKLDLKTGKVVATGRGSGKGSIIYADGLLYGYGESGRIAIIDPKSAELATISQFRQTAGSGQNWAHPTLNNGRLLIRHGDVLICYDVRAK